MASPTLSYISRRLSIFCFILSLIYACLRHCLIRWSFLRAIYRRRRPMLCPGAIRATRWYASCRWRAPAAELLCHASYAPIYAPRFSRRALAPPPPTAPPFMHDAAAYATPCAAATRYTQILRCRHARRRDAAAAAMMFCYDYAIDTPAEPLCASLFFAPLRLPQMSYELDARLRGLFCRRDEPVLSSFFLIFSFFHVLASSFYAFIMSRLALHLLSFLMPLFLWLKISSFFIWFSFLIAIFCAFIFAFMKSHFPSLFIFAGAVSLIFIASDLMPPFSSAPFYWFITPDVILAYLLLHVWRASPLAISMSRLLITRAWALSITRAWYRRDYLRVFFHCRLRHFTI